MYVNVMFVVALLAVKSQEDQPEHVERRKQRGRQPEAIQKVSDIAAAIFALEGAQENRIFAEESCEGWETGNRERGNQHRRVGVLDFLAEAAHAIHVLLAAHGVNHAAGCKKEQSLEKRMRHQVKNSGGK